MHIQIWIGIEYLDQLHKNMESPLAIDDVFDNAVEYTEIAVMEGQIQVSIKYDKYVELSDNGLLVPWTGYKQEI
jgi:DNA gyrase/topoisomerase IV subunit B